MEESSTEARPARRRRSRKRRLLRALQRYVPLLLICVAAMLSTGVVRVMEIGQAERDGSVGPRGLDPVESQRVGRTDRARSDHSDRARDPTIEKISSDAVSLEDVLGASVLDENPDERGPDEHESETPSLERLEGLEDPDAALSHFGVDALARVPEPGTFLLVATGLAWLLAPASGTD